MMHKQAGVRQTLDMAHAAGSLIQEVRGIAQQSWPHIQRTGQNVAQLAGHHGPVVERGLDIAHRLVGSAAAAEAGIDRTARGLEQGAQYSGALRTMVEDARHVHGRLTRQTRPHPALMAGAGAGATVGALLAADALATPLTTPQGGSMTPYDSYMLQSKEAASLRGIWQTVKGYAKEAPGAARAGADVLADAIKTHGPKVLDALHETAKATGSARVIKENVPHLLEGAGEIVDAVKGHLGVKKKLPGWVLPAGIGAGGVALGSMAMGAMNDQRR